MSVFDDATEWIENNLKVDKGFIKMLSRKS